MRKKLCKIGITAISFFLLMIATSCSPEQSKEKVEITQDFVPDNKHRRRQTEYLCDCKIYDK